MEPNLGFDDLSTDSVATAQSHSDKKGKAKADKEKSVSTRAVAQAAKLSQAKHAERNKQDSRDTAISKLAKIEQYQIHFGGKLKGRYKKISPDSSTADAEADLQLMQIEKELSSEGAAPMMENIWLMFIKVFSEGYTLLGSPYGFRLTGRKSAADVAATDKWMDRVKTNLLLLQIKYGLFETGPILQLAVAFGGIMVEAHEINSAGHQHENPNAPPVDPEKQKAKYDKL